VIRDGEVHGFKTENGSQVPQSIPEKPTEEWYAILAKIHHDNGHRGRDGVFKRLTSITPSISKGFVAAYVSCCCPQAKSSPRLEPCVGEEPTKADKPSKSKKRAIEEADLSSLSPPAKRPKAHSTVQAMINAGDEQDPSLRNDNSLAQMGVEVSAMRL
jgi:hypothetical protein